jgi:hypothetical protein
MRARARRDKLGKPSPCTAQDIAYCVRTASATTISHRFLCSRTAEDCKTQRARMIAKESRPFDHASECAPIRNIDTYETIPPDSWPPATATATP